MDIFEHFACYTNLPVRIQDVCDQALEYSHVDDFSFEKVLMDPATLRGMSLVYEVNGAYTKKIARIIYSSSLPDEETVRMVCCKEILHTIDGNNISAASREAVSSLIDNIVMPPSVHHMTTSTLSDHLGMLQALMILLPRDALTILRPKYENGQLSAEEIARLAVIPDAYARLALSSGWAEIVEAIE